MPASWSKKDERQYKHILTTCKKTRKGAQVCKRIAAATVNKTRAKQGRTLRGAKQTGCAQVQLCNYFNPKLPTYSYNMQNGWTVMRKLADGTTANTLHSCDPNEAAVRAFARKWNKEHGCADKRYLKGCRSKRCR